MRRSTQAFSLRVVIEQQAAEVLSRIRSRMDAILRGAGMFGYVTYDIEVVSELPDAGSGGKSRLIVDT